MKLFQDDLIKNLPDCYNKERNSNNYKLLQLIKYDSDKYRDLLNELFECLDLDSAKGYTLNLFGEMVGQKRGLATDEQYLILIKTKIARNRCKGDYLSIVDCLCRILKCKPSDILVENDDKPATVKIAKIALDTILLADMTPSQFTQLVKSMLPAGVALESSVYAGTFTFSDSEDEASMTEGFCQNEGDDYGGYFGVLSEDNAGTVLPY